MTIYHNLHLFIFFCPSRIRAPSSRIFPPALSNSRNAPLSRERGVCIAPIRSDVPRTSAGNAPRFIRSFTAATLPEARPEIRRGPPPMNHMVRRASASSSTRTYDRTTNNYITSLFLSLSLARTRKRARAVTNCAETIPLLTDFPPPVRLSQPLSRGCSRARSHPATKRRTV